MAKFNIMKPLLVATILFLHAVHVYAQKAPSPEVQFRILDSLDKAPLEYVSVKLVCKDDIISGGVTSIKGECSVPLKESLYPFTGITISRTGYFTKTVPAGQLTFGANPVIVYLQPAVIKEQTAIVTASAITKEVDKTIYRIKQTEFPAGTKIMEMINRVPSLSSNGSTDVLIKGRIRADVYIDGKMVNAEVIKNIPVAAVKNIEVIENPNAAIGSEGEGGIINIILRKDAQLSGGSISLSTGLIRPLTIGGGNFMLSNKKIFWLFSVSGQASVQGRVTTLNRNSLFSNAGYTQYSSATSKPYYYTAHTELFYKPDSLTQISAILYTTTMGARSAANSHAYALRNNQPCNPINTENNYRFRNRSFSSTLEYKKQVTKQLQYIITGGYQRNIKTIRNESFEQMLPMADKTGSRQWDTAGINNYSFQALASRKNKKRKVHEWENGILAKYEHSGDRYSQYRLQPDAHYNMLPQNSGRFHFEKTIAAAYTQLKFNGKNKTQFSTGLRAEYFSFRLLYTDASKNTAHSFFNIFPTLGILRPLKKDYNLQLNYSRRIKRPDITILSSFYYGTNRALVNTGNPELLPEIANKISGSLSRFHNGKYADVSVYGTWKARPLFERSIRSVIDSSIIRTTGNFRGYYSGGASFTFTLPVKKIISFNGSFYAEAFHLTNGRPLLQKHSGIIAGGNLGMNITLKNKLSIDGYISYSNYTYEYQQITKNLPLGILSVRKTVLKDKLNISLSWMDVFETGFNRVKEYNDGFVTQHATETGTNNNVSIGLTYNFGRTLRNNNKQKGLVADDVKERKNSD